MTESGFSPAVEDVLMRAGMTLGFVQHAESAIRLALTHAFPESEPVTIESIEASTEEMQRDTLGQLLRRLRERGIAIDADFDDFLSGFLRRRNFFAHKIYVDAEHDINTADGLVRFRTFVETLGAECFRVAGVFTAAAVAFTKERNDGGGFVFPNAPGDQEAFQSSFLKAVDVGRFFKK